MKGLHGGIPLAVLAATAHAQSQGIGGSHGLDIGNQASIPTENTASTSVTGTYNDDHSFELEHEVHIYGGGKGKDHDKRTAGAPQDTAIGGPGGVDVGNTADIPTLNSFSASVDEEYNDNHSVKVDKTTIIKGAKDKGHGGHDGHWRRDEDEDDRFPEVPANPTVIGGPAGVDIGNIADIPTFNEFSASVDETYNDDHSVDIDKTTIIKGKEHERRNGPTAIAGSGGVDVGSATVIPTINEFSSSFTGKYKDDHSIDIEKTTIIKPHHDEHPARGFHHPMHQARGEEGPTVIGGPGGVDIGNVADIPTLNSFTSSVDETYTDNHSIDVDKTFIVKPHKRAVRPGVEEEREDGTAIGGPGGVDVGNVFSAPTVNSYNSNTHENVNDDHSVKITSHEVVKPGSPHYEGHGEQHEGHDEQHEGHDEQHEGHDDQQQKPAKPQESECTQVQQVVHTVTSTRTEVAYQTHVAVVDPHESDSEQGESEHADSEHNSPGTQTQWGGSSDKDNSEPPKEAEHSNSNHNHPQGSSQSQSGSDSSHYNTGSASNDDESPEDSNNDHESNYPEAESQSPPSGSDTSRSNTASGSNDDESPEDNSNDDEPNSSSAAKNEDYHGSRAAPAPAATPYHHAGQAVETAAAHATPTGAHHAAASTFAVVPVQVPGASGTPRAHGSAAVPASSTPVSSSAFRNMPVPTGASADQNERPQESNGVVAFTGAGVKSVAAVSVAGVFSALAGVFVLLGFAL